MEVKVLSGSENIDKQFNYPLLPQSIRDLVVGKSGCSKKNSIREPATMIRVA